MAIDFFAAKCITQTKERVFGIHDIPPAVLVFQDEDLWIAWVDNETGMDVTFTAIDKCLDIADNEGERCEGMITYADTIIFVELKDRDGGRWAGKSRDQLINSIKLFKRDANIDSFRKMYGHIANKQRPYFHAGGMRFFEEFEEKTGFILRVSDVIKIE